MFEDLAPVEPDEPFARRAGESNSFNPHLNTLWVEMPLDQISNHEMNHFLAHASTPYGFFLQTLVDLQTRVAADYFEQAWRQAPGVKAPVPVKQFAQSKASADSQLRPLVEKFVKPWSWLVFLERVFEGENLPSARDAKRREAVRALNLFEALFTERLGARKIFDEERTAKDERMGPVARRALEPLVEPEENLDRPACKSGKWFHNHIFPLGAGHVMETLAQQTQASFQEGGAPPSAADFERPGAELYWFFYLKTGELYGLEGMRTVEGYRKLYSTIIALADLALFAPIGPVYGRLRTSKTKWEDVNPALRYMRALQAAPHVGWIDDLSKQLRPFQQTICEIFDWPAPETCLRLGALVDPTLPAWRRHREACELRLQNPTAFLIIERSHFYDEFLDRHVPILYHPDVGEVVVRSWTEGESIELLVNHFLPQWCWRMMNQGVPDYAALLPARLRFDRLAYSELRTPADFIALLVRDNPWMEPSRYVQFKG